MIGEDVVDDLLDNSDSDSGATVWSAVRGFLTGRDGLVQVTPFNVSGLFLLAGDIRLAEFENDLHDQWTQCFQRKSRGYRITSSLSDLITNTCETYNIDFVFYDAGPNVGPLNRIILLDSDYFIVPMACDLLSLRALKTLGRSLNGWIQDWQTIRQLAPVSENLLVGLPKLVGYIPQRFRIYRGMPAQGHTKYFSQMSKRIDSDVAKVLSLIDPQLVVRGQAGVSQLGPVRDFGALAAKSQTEGVPIADVGGLAGSTRHEIRAAFDRIAGQIVKLTQSPTVRKKH